MALHYRTLGFVVKKRDSGESDRIFTLVTKNFGKVNLLGRAIRKISSKLKGGLEMGSLSEVEFIQGKSVKTLTDAILVEKYKNIKTDLLKNRVAHKIAKVSDSLLPTEEKENVHFDLLEKTYSRLNGEGIKKETVPMIYFYFLWNFFAILGYKPELSKCSKCHRGSILNSICFAPKEGGLLCLDCQGNYFEQKIKINEDVVKALQIILKRSWPTAKEIRLSQNSSKLIKDLSNEYYSYLLSGHPAKRF